MQVVQKPAEKDVEVEIRNAYRALQTAQANLQIGDPDAAVSRCYYASFYAARAVLWTQGHAPRTHRGLMHLFGMHLIREGLVDEEMMGILLRGQAQREYADYMQEDVSAEQAERLIEESRKFVDVMATLLEDRGYVVERS